MACAQSPRHPGHRILLLGATPDSVRNASMLAGEKRGNLSLFLPPDFEGLITLKGLSGQGDLMLWPSYFSPSLLLHPDLSKDHLPSPSLASPSSLVPG